MAELLAIQTGGLAVAILAPGMGYKCSDPTGYVYANVTECQLVGDHFTDQISSGSPMSGPHFLEGWNPIYYPTPNPKFSLFYGYAHSAMRAVTMVEAVFDSQNPFSFTGPRHPWVKDVVSPIGQHRPLVGITGMSGGGVTTLLVNNYDNRIHAAASFLALGDWTDIFDTHDNWILKTITASGISPFGPRLPPAEETLNCSSTYTPGTLEWQVCQLVQTEDPIYAVPQLSPVMLVAGAQDDCFPINGYAKTRDAFINAGGAYAVYTHIVGDWDHGAWFGGWTGDVGSNPPWKNHHYGYLAAAYNDTGNGYAGWDTLVAFLAKGMNPNDSTGLGDFGDWQMPAPQTSVCSNCPFWKTWTVTAAIQSSAHFESDVVMLGGSDSYSHYNFYDQFSPEWRLAQLEYGIDPAGPRDVQPDAVLANRLLGCRHGILPPMDGGGFVSVRIRFRPLVLQLVERLPREQ